MNSFRFVLLAALLAVVLNPLVPSQNACAQNVVKEVLRSGAVGDNLLRAEQFHGYESGFQLENGVYCCDNGSDANAKRGVAQTVTLNQTRPEPILAEVWSRAENVSGTPNGDYGIYLDLVHNDGTPLWGQTVAFATGTHDWQKKTLLILPKKPIQSLTFYAMFRNKSGKAEFRDMKLSVMPFPENGCLFDGVPVIPKKKTGSQEGFQIRDVAADSDYFELKGNPFGIASKVEQAGAISKVTLNNTDGKDHCLTLVYAMDIPFHANYQIWCENPRTNVDVKPNTEYVLATSIPGIGSSGRLSLYPFAAVTEKPTDIKEGQGEGVISPGIGIDMKTPAFFRAGYHSGTGELYVAVDLALTKESPTATINFVRLGFAPRDGFRGVLEGYYRCFPSSFECRAHEQGVWMPFAAISKVPHYEDFGFRFKEGNDEVAWDDAHDILTFRYTEPMTWWMSIPPEKPQTYETALEQAKQLAAKNDPMATALFKSGMHDTDGKFVCQLLDTPWCKGAVWSMNDLPAIEDGSFSQRWSPKIENTYYEDKKQGDLDGEYVDSSEGYVTAELDFNRAHFSAAKTPLVFSRGDCRPAVFRGLVAFEYVRKIAEDMHARNKLMMANATPDRLCWLAPWLDVMGTETNWNDNDQWSPMSDDQMLYRRAMCGPKPYCFLMNTDFSKFTYDMSERFMKRSLAYGMFPGYFSADASTGQYFTRPELYERDRPLFKKYIPLCKIVAQAGWQPLTLATSSDPSVHVERFGFDATKMYFTVFNDSPEKKTVTLQFQHPYTTFKDLVSGKTEKIDRGTLKLTLPPEGIAVLECGK
ncbi:MAG: hypothetical protein FWC50_04005 [Planctomycetaceae bacterium]|nr:hypothetical protein [Planctomycetaceae bacterium]